MEEVPEHRIADTRENVFRSLHTKFSSLFYVPQQKMWLRVKPRRDSIFCLLFNIAEDQARKEGYIHRGITCNSCQTSPICGIRYKCANCVDYDVCERCEVRDDHNKTHLFIKIRIPMPPLTNPRAPCLKPLYPGYYAFSNFTNHKNYNFLNCDWFKKLLFPTNSLAKLLSDSSTNQSNSEL